MSGVHTEKKNVYSVTLKGTFYYLGKVALFLKKNGRSFPLEILSCSIKIGILFIGKVCSVPLKTGVLFH